MTPQEITAHALLLGITPELYPELWGWHCDTCGYTGHDKDCGCAAYPQNTIAVSLLPDPLSDDPRARLYEPFYMRALGWPRIEPDRDRGFILRQGWASPIREATPTAALHAAWLAKGASK